MRKFTTLLFSFALFFLFTNISHAGEMPDITVKTNGTVQFWGSFAQTDTDTAEAGFGLRRVRLRFTGTMGPNLKAFVQMELTTPKLLDARIQYKLSENAELRVGRFIGAGMRGGGLTSHTVIDIIERPVSAQKWGSMTIGADYRDYGMALLGKYSDISYNITLHNGDGAVNIKPSHKSTASTQTTGAAVSGMLTYKPATVKGLEAGGYYGMGNKYFNEYSSYSGYLYFEPLPYRVKAEYVAVVDKNGPKDVTFNGYYIFGAYRIQNNIELLARWEQVDPNTDVDKNEETDITFGASYAFFPEKWSASNITAAYVIQDEDANIDNNIFYIMFQLVF